MVDTATTVRYTLSLHDALPISDRVDRRHLFLGSIVSRSLLATALAAAIMLHSGTAALIVLSFAFTACGTPCFPVALASLPNLVPSRDLDRPTAMIGMVDTAAYLGA